MVKIRVIILALVVSMGFAQAQVNRYMVFFNDKVGTPFTVSSPENFLSQRAIDRRENQNITIVEQDLPVTPAYVIDVQNAGATVLYKTKWMNGVLVECDATLVETLEGLAIVERVEFVAPGPRPPGARVKASTKFNEPDESAATTDVQISMLGMDAMHNAGYKGEGMFIAILDAGFPGADTIQYFDHVFNEGRFDAATSYDFVSGGSNVFRHHSHGTNVWSTIGAFKQNVFVGGAYKAKFVLFVTEHAPNEYRVEEYNWLFAAERSDSVGVDVINTSLGYRIFDDLSMNYAVADMDGLTAVITRAADIASSKGIAVVVSAGNEGNSIPTTIGAPADAESVLSIGAVNSAGVLTSFSSIGPTSDGRIKPDVVALGSGVSVIDPNGAIRATASGTSFAGPLTTSLVAGVWQMLPDLTAAEVLDTIRARASQFNSPDNFMGYGIPNYTFVVTGVDPETESFVSVYPNPAKDQVKIELKYQIAGPLNVSMVDTKGAESSVQVTTISESEIVIDLSGQRPGLYVLRCQLGSKISFHKILKVE